MPSALLSDQYSRAIISDCFSGDSSAGSPIAIVIEAIANPSRDMRGFEVHSFEYVEEGGRLVVRSNVVRQQILAAYKDFE